MPPLHDLMAKVEAEWGHLETLQGRVDGGVFRCAKAYAAAVAGTTTWYATGKRHIHEPQLEAIVGELEHHIAGVESLVELGAGKGLLGRILQEAIGKPLLVVERRGCAHYDHDATQRISTDLQEVNLDTAIPPKSLVLAKHFCGNATDSAIRSVIESEKAIVCAIAPCCHPQISWQTYTGRAYLEGLGFDENDFATFLEFLFMSRNKGGVVSSASCKRWKDLRALPENTIYRMGRMCRRLIEEGRLTALRGGGFSEAKLVKYAPDSITPDNYLLVAHRNTATNCYPTVSVDSQIVPISEGVVLHVTGEKSAPGRIAQYLLEKRARDVLSNGTSCLHTVRIHNLKYGGVVVVVGGTPSEILCYLKGNMFLTSSVDMAFPFVRQYPVRVEDGEGEIGEMVAGIVDGGLMQNVVEKDGGESEAKRVKEETSVRICCLPRTMEATHFARYFRDDDPNKATRGFTFSPKTFTHTFYLFLWEDQMGARVLLAGLYHQALFNPRDWRSTSLPSSFSFEGNQIKCNKTTKKLVHLTEEVEHRWGSHSVCGKTVLILCDDIVDSWGNAYCQYLKTKGAKVVCITSPIKEKGEEGVEATYRLQPPPPEGSSYDMCIFILDRGEQAAVLRGSLPEGLVTPNAPMYGRLKLGVQARSRQVVERQTSAFKAEGFPAVIQHLLVDRESDRTVLTSWGTKPASKKEA